MHRETCNECGDKVRLERPCHVADIVLDIIIPWLASLDAKHAAVGVSPTTLGDELDRIDMG